MPPLSPFRVPSCRLANLRCDLAAGQVFRRLIECVATLSLATVPAAALAALPAVSGVADPDHATSSSLPPMQDDDFHVIVGNAEEAQKYLTYGWSGWAGRTVRWRYNDSNRPVSIVANQGTAVARIQAAMAKWSAECNIQFVYDGTTSAGASLPSNSRDSLNVVAWGALSGNTTGTTYVSASGASAASLAIDESDMVLNHQFNPNLDATLVHEVGHMLGLKHSNVESTVMSGPNTAPDLSTAYTGLAALQPDDISGCRALYGAPAGVLPATRQMVEFRYLPLDYYFITSRDSEKAVLDATLGWARTGASFPVYGSAPVGAKGISRFYFDRVARGGTRGSHFYTLLDSDVAALVNLNPAQSTAPTLPQNEGVDSYGYLPLVSGAGGSCASGLLPVYRAFRGGIRFPDDPNHRFTTNIVAYNSLVAQGWDGEGVAFCVPAN